MKRKTKRVKNDENEVENIRKKSKKTNYKYKEGKETNREEKKKKRRPSEQKTEDFERKNKKGEPYEHNDNNYERTKDEIIHDTLCEKDERKPKKKKDKTEIEIEVIKKNYEEANIAGENMKIIEDDETKKKKRKEKKKQKERQYTKKEGSAQVLQMNNACQLRWFENDDASEFPVEETKENFKQEKTEKDMRISGIKKDTKEKTDKKKRKEERKEKEEEKEEEEKKEKEKKEKREKKEKEEKEERGEVNESKNTSEDQQSKCKPVDFERLVASARNSSAVWISYIGYYIEQGNINEARKVAERALKCIDMNKTKEKLNIYLCYLNMECVYGNRIEEIFKRALIYNDEKQIYVHMIYILKKHKKLKQLKEICEKAIKKFKYSKKIWVCYLEVLHDVFKDEETAHEVLLKSLHSLAKRKHLYMIISAARFEYKYSNKERGKAYFEKLIAEFPKRSDIWFTYLDVHISSLLKDNKGDEVKENEKIENMNGENAKIGKRRKERKKLSTSELESVRNIFERFCALKFKPRVMKLIFTKWLFFERNHGSPYHEKMVQQKAFDYVESLNTEE